MASLALSLLPALLVEREAGPLAAALAMGVARAAAVVGSLGGGVLSDRYGLRPILVGSLLLAGTGALAMVPRGSLALLVLGATLVQVGTGVFPIVIRLALVRLVPAEHQREALAWMRSTTNLGLVVSFGLGAALGTSVGLLLLLDAVASLGAAALATRLPDRADTAPPPAPAGAGGGTLHAFAWATAVVATWGLAYEAYVTATAAQLREVLGPAGVSWYSGVMLGNVVGCALLGVVFARAIAEPRWSIPAGALLLVGGATLGVAWPGWKPAVAAGMLLVTVGELVFTATSQFVWMTLLPDTPRRSTVFAVATTATSLARAMGAALAFPLVVDLRVPGLGMAALALAVLVLGATAEPVWRAFRAAHVP